MTKFRFDPNTQCSEVSLLRDLVNPEPFQKFVKQVLPEVEIGFYLRNRPGINTEYTNSEIPPEEIEEDFDEMDEDNDEEIDSEYFDNDMA